MTLVGGENVCPLVMASPLGGCLHFPLLSIWLLPHRGQLSSGRMMES